MNGKIYIKNHPTFDILELELTYLYIILAPYLIAGIGRPLYSEFAQKKNGASYR